MSSSHRLSPSIYSSLCLCLCVCLFLCLSLSVSNFHSLSHSLPPSPSLSHTHALPVSLSILSLSPCLCRHPTSMCVSSLVLSLSATQIHFILLRHESTITDPVWSVPACLESVKYVTCPHLMSEHPAVTLN